MFTGMCIDSPVLPDRRAMVDSPSTLIMALLRSITDSAQAMDVAVNDAYEAYSPGDPESRILLAKMLAEADVVADIHDMIQRRLGCA
jgi:hypothetical protein